MSQIDAHYLIRRISLRQLQIFEAVARLESFTRAAEALHLSQPTVSMQLKKLAETLGLALFEHVGKRVYLTAAGEDLLATCRQVFDAFGQLEMSIAEMKGLKKGRLRLAAVTTLEYFTPRVLGAFCERHPGIDVELEVTNRERLLERLMANRDDLYFFGAPPGGLDVEARPFLHNPLVVLAARNHPLAQARRIPLARLIEEPFIMREQGSGTRKAAETFFAEHGLRPEVRLELGSNEAIRQAVAGGLGVAVLSRHILSLDRETGPVIVLDVEGFPLEKQWYLVYPRGKRLSVVAQAFHDYLLTRGPELADASPPPRAPGTKGHQSTSRSASSAE